MDESSQSTSRVHVVAGIIRDAHGRVLLARRPQGKELAGFWEFPGGKVEPGESVATALIRELEEELGIDARIGAPVISVPHGRIRLDAIEVASHLGRPRSREGQALAWIAPEAIDVDLLPQADRPVVAALRLPDRYLITPTPGENDIPGFLHSIERALIAGIRLLQLRLPGWSRESVTPLARSIRDRCRDCGATLLLNADWRLAEILGLDGVHLPSHIAMTLTRRPMARDRWLAVSCHNAEELHHAASIGADFATLSPVNFTPDHGEAVALGWERTAALISDAPLPVYALGGMHANDIEKSRDCGAQGVAAIRSLWID